MNYHIGARYQRGRGIGALFSGLLRGFAPIARMGLNLGRKVISSDLVKNVAGQALNSGKKLALGMAADLLEGKNIKESAEEQLNEARKNIATTLRGGGCRKRRKQLVSKHHKRRKHSQYNLLDDDE